jgi:hypothetical protein
MKPQTSTDYNIDNRYSGAASATDNTVGKQFLNRYINAAKFVGAKSAGTLEEKHLTEKRKQTDHFLLGGMGGTVPIGALNLGQQLTNTDTAYRFKNAFGSPQSPVQRRLSHVD